MSIRKELYGDRRMPKRSLISGRNAREDGGK